MSATAAGTNQDVYKALVAAAAEASHLYYNDPDNAIIPDDEFDDLVDKIRAFEEVHPEWIVPDSPTQRVGAPLDAVGTDVYAHPIPMLSLAKVTTDEQLERFINTFSSGINVFLVQPKLDGISMSLEYERGKLRRAVTRGDGRRGEDVTEKMRLLDTVPTYISLSPMRAIYDFTGVVRGEVVIHKDELSPRFKNTRNGVAGAVASSRIEDARDEHARFYAFDAHSTDPESPQDAEKNLRALGFTEAPTIKATRSEVVGVVHQLLQDRKAYPYGTDGVVVKVADRTTRENLMDRTNTPRWAVAFKEAGATAETKLLGVLAQVGKSGNLGLVAVLEPVDLDGTTISRATLHNPAIIRQLDLHLGDIVTITRANDVIPRILGVAQVAGTRVPIELPTRCPGCDGELIETGNSGILKCTSQDCFPQVVRRLVHWASRKAADIDSISTTWIETFVENGLVEDIGDLYELTRADLMSFDNMGEGRATRFLESIEKSKGVGMRRALIGLAIPNASEGTAARLCKEFAHIEDVMVAEVAQLAAVPDVGVVVATSLYDFFHDEDNKNLILDLGDMGVNLGRLPEDAPLEISDVEGLAFAGKVVVVTGKLTTPRDEFERELELNGAKVTGSVSKKTDLLIIGENVGATKTNKAKQVGTTVVTEATARQMMAQ